MFRLTLLGAIDLEGSDGRHIRSILSQPKRLALLAILALEAPRRVQRDAVMARLWPDWSEDRARNALRQSLHYLRRSLGPGVVGGKGEEGIGIEAGALESDARALLDAAGAGRHAEVLELYGGELMAGFHLDDAPLEFEEWLRESRRKVRRAAVAAAWAVADAEAEAGHAVAAGSAARRAWELGEQREPELRRLLRLLVRTGDVSGAREAYEDFAGRQRRRGGEPDEETRAILPALETSASLEAASSGGPEPSAGIHEAPGRPASADPGGAPAVGSPTPPAPGAPRWRRGWTAALAVAAVLLLWSAGPWWSGYWGGGPTDLSGAPRLYVEPVSDLTGGTRWTELAGSLGAELAVELLETGGFEVVALRAGEATEGPGARLRPLLRAGADGVELSVLILDPASAEVLERVTVEVSGDRAGPELMARRAAPAIRREVGEVLAWRALEEQVDGETFRALRAAAEEVSAAMALADRGAQDAALLALQAADSALAEIQEEHPGWMELPLRRAEVARNAMWVRLLADPESHGAATTQQAALAGLRHAERAVALAPEDSRALEIRGVLRFWVGQTRADRQRTLFFDEEAEEDLVRAVRLDPDLPRAWNILSAISERRGHYDLAYHRARQAYSANHGLEVPLDILVRLFTAGLEVGDTEGVAGWCEKTRARAPESWLGPYCDLHRLAWLESPSPEVGDSLFAEAVARVPDRPLAAPLIERFELTLAVVLAAGGEGDRARAILAGGDSGGGASIEVSVLRAWALTELGEMARAREVLVRACESHGAPAEVMLKSRRFEELGIARVAVNRN